MEMDIRQPKQKRAIEKKEKIIDSGFELICENGYYNTNTAEIAKKADVSTGIVYQYFKDKHAIFMAAIDKYGDDIFFPMLNINNINFKTASFESVMRNMVDGYIKNHRVSEIAHEEIMSMIHSDSDVAGYYYKRELQMTEKIKRLLITNNFKDNHLYEKVHIMIGMIDNLCHEIIYHKHKSMDYDAMTNIVIDNITNLFKNDIT